MRRLLFIIMLLQVDLLNANPLFNGFTASYDVSRNNVYLGTSSRQLLARDKGRSLEYSATTQPRGVVAMFASDRFIEHSLIKVTKKGLFPQRYDYQRTGGKKEFAFQANFDWKKKLLHTTSSPDPQPLLTDTQDLLSFQLELMRGLQKGKRKFSFHIVDHKRVQLQTLEYTQTLSMDTSQGKLEVLQLEHQAVDSQYRFTFWCAEKLHFLPIMIQKTEQDGDISQLKLTHLNGQELRLLSPAPQQ